LYLKYYSDIFNYNGLSGDVYLAASYYIVLCFEAQYAFRAFFFFCPTLPKTQLVLGKYHRWGQAVIELS